MTVDPEPSSELASLAARVVRLEELFLHLERTMGDLSDVLRYLEKRIDALDRRLDDLADEGQEES